MGNDYYNFVEHFLFPVMSLMASAIPRLSIASQLYLRMPHGEAGDWFFTEKGTFIRLYDFLRAPFLLPIHVIDWVFSMEFARQIDYIDAKYEVIARKRVTYSLPLKVHDLVLQRRGGSESLKQKLLALKLKKINQFLLYDPEDIFSKKLRS